MAEKSKSSGPSSLAIYTGIASLAAGSYHGYCDAQGIPFEKENLEWALTYGPTIIQAGLFGVVGGFAGTILGGLIGTNRINYYDKLSEKIIKGTAGSLLGVTGGAAVGAGIGAARRGLQTLIGYGLGYTAGKLVG